MAKNLQENDKFSAQNGLRLPDPWDRTVHGFSDLPLRVQKTKSPSKRLEPWRPDSRPIRVGQPRQERVVPKTWVQGLGRGRDVLEGVTERVLDEGPREQEGGGGGGGLSPMYNVRKLFASFLSRP